MHQLVQHSDRRSAARHDRVGRVRDVPDADAVADAIARNTRQLRTTRGWSLDQLATRSGVSKGMLVQIEQARTNPSIGTLCRVADAFGVTLAQLVELADESSVRVVDAAEVVRLWSGSEGSGGDLLVGTDRNEHVELWRWHLAAKAWPPFS